jgi:hypothetical protein
MKEINYDKLIQDCREIVKCDTARISKPLEKGKMYLIIGFNRNTADDKQNQWTNQDGERIDFNYVEERVIASGKTKKELIENTREYQRLCGITWEQYFKEQQEGFNKNIAVLNKD